MDSKEFIMDLRARQLNLLRLRGINLKDVLKVFYKYEKGPSPSREEAAFYDEAVTILREHGCIDSYLDSHYRSKSENTPTETPVIKVSPIALKVLPEDAERERRQIEEDEELQRLITRQWERTKTQRILVRTKIRRTTVVLMAVLVVLAVFATASKYGLKLWNQKKAAAGVTNAVKPPQKDKKDKPAKYEHQLQEQAERIEKAGKE
jgi:hypothetical protein